MHLFFPLRTLFCGCQLFQVLVGLPRCLSGQQLGWLEILALSYLHFWDWDPVVSGAWSMGCAWLKVSHGVGSPKHLGCVIAHSPDIDQPSRQFTSEMVPIQFWPFFFFSYEMQICGVFGGRQQEAKHWGILGFSTRERKIHCIVNKHIL